MAVLQRPAATKKSSEGGGMIVAGPALEIAPLDRLILRIGKDQRTVLRERCRSQRKKNDDCRDHAKNRKAKDQTSVTSVTFSALPSMTVPPRSRVAEISLDTKRTVICAVVRLRSSAAVMVEPSIETKRVSAVSLRRSRSVIAASKPS